MGTKLQAMIDEDEKLSLRDGLPMLRRQVLTSIKSFELRHFEPTGWEPDVTKDDTLVFDISVNYRDTSYVFALRPDTLTWHLLQTVPGPDGLVWLKDHNGNKHNSESYLASLPVKYILKHIR
jgi:hypothetical protein